MIKLKTRLLVPVFTVLAACSDKTPPAPTPAPAVPPAAAPAPTAEGDLLPPASDDSMMAATKPKASDVKVVATREFQCATGGVLKLEDYSDDSTHVMVKGAPHVLHSVGVDGGSLLQGDNISVRLVGEQATASENGVVLYSGCKSAGKAG